MTVHERLLPVLRESSGDIPVREVFPRAWYLVCRSANVPLPRKGRTGERGGIVSRDFLGHPIILLRSKEGELLALDAHCPHMGTHLGGGGMHQGDCIRCPMHHWTFELSGACRGNGEGRRAGLRAWPVAERFGCVFVYFGSEPRYELPGFELPDERLRAATGRVVSIECPWMAVSANAYDMQHLRTVHERALRETPVAECIDPYHLRLRYVSRVTGHGLPDRVMKWLSGDTIHVTITCIGGPLFTVESRLGKRRSMLLLGIMPKGKGVEITPVFVRQRTGIGAVDRMGLAMSGWLFTRFLEKDLSSLHRMRFKAPQGLKPEDPLQRFFDFIEQLPMGPAGEAGPGGGDEERGWK